jgi:hypothetical protein
LKDLVLSVGILGSGFGNEIAKVDLSDIHLNYYNSSLLGALCLVCAISDHKFPRMRLLSGNTHSSDYHHIIVAF